MAIDPSLGGRIARLVVDQVDMIVGARSQHDDPLDWGLYPMAPFAGRLRNGVLGWRDRTHTFPRLRPPHALHGTVHDTQWELDHVDDSMCSMSTALVDPWPFPGRVTHRITLHRDHLALRLTLDADVDMPAQLGWHPWFNKPESVDLTANAIHPRDADGIASARPEPIEQLSWGDLDDCFTEVDENLTITIDGRRLRLRTSCRQWVVYDRPSHATCIEPQSGPPNALNDDPVIVSAGTSTSEWFTLSWEE